MKDIEKEINEAFDKCAHVRYRVIRDHVVCLDCGKHLAYYDMGNRAILLK